MTLPKLTIFTVLISLRLHFTCGIRISVNPPFISSISINPTFTCTPEAADTGCIFTLWKFNETVINTNLAKYTTLAFKEHQKLLVSDHNVDDVGTYTCVYTCGAGNLRSPSIFLRYIPDIIISTPDGLVYYAYQHDNVTLECEAEHQTNQYWYFVESNQIIQMGTKYYASGTSLVIRDVGPADAVAYGCALYNMAHSDPIRNLAHVDVYAKPNISLSSSQSVLEGQSVSVTCSSYGIPKPTLTWIRNTQVIGSGGRILQQYSENGYFVHNTLTIHQVHHSDSGLYRCYVANTNGSLASMTNLTVKSPPQPFLDIFLIEVTNTSANFSLILGLLNSSEIDVNISVTWKLGLSHDLIGQRKVSGANPSFLLDNLLPNTAYFVNATLHELVDTEEFNTSSGITVVNPNYTTEPSHTSFHISSTLSHTIFTRTPQSSNGPVAQSPISEGFMFAIVGAVVVTLMMLMMMVVVLVVVIMRCRRTGNRMKHSFGSSRSDAFPIYNKQNSSISNVSNDNFTPNSITSNPNQFVVHCPVVPHPVTMNSLYAQQQSLDQQLPVVFHVGADDHNTSAGFEMTENAAYNEEHLQENGATCSPPPYSLPSHCSRDFLGCDKEVEPADSCIESASQVHMDVGMPPDYPCMVGTMEENRFEYTNNTNYEGHTPPSLGKDKRFEIISKGRGKVFEVVKIKK